MFVVTMLFICICKLGCLSWPGHSWKRDFNLSESFSWLNKGVYIRRQAESETESAGRSKSWMESEMRGCAGINSLKLDRSNPRACRFFSEITGRGETREQGRRGHLH